MILDIYSKLIEIDENFWSEISQSKLIQFWHVGGVLESSGWAYSKTGLPIRARFVGEIKVFHCPKCCVPPLYLFYWSVQTDLTVLS